MTFGSFCKHDEKVVELRNRSWSLIEKNVQLGDQPENFTLQKVGNGRSLHSVGAKWVSVWPEKSPNVY